ncbi:M23 family metallopeptidase [Sphingobium estronivorans]|uniref:M23 family metallopeptidase n=1 Tax=Sphingobium estronivorans TaxID=1577690 RepID=UPI001F0753EC|nr:M23 family metallopeptidase [Sphingobium estronivorans]
MQMANVRLVAHCSAPVTIMALTAILLPGAALANGAGAVPVSKERSRSSLEQIGNYASPSRNETATAISTAAASGSVTFGRAADLVGTPLYLKPEPRPISGLRGSLPSGLPVAARSLTSDFGMRAHPLLGGFRPHLGVDLAAPAGSPITAMSDGQVSWSGWRGGYGLFVALDHGNGVQTRYGHMSRINVAPGQRVHKGDTIGYVGSTGLSTGPHLHYEMRVNGQAVNPRPLLTQ